MVIDVEDNPNCPGCGVMRFQELSLPRQLTRMAHEVDGAPIACRVTGWGPDGPQPARVRKVMDSGDGSAWLVYGGEWGLRLAPADAEPDWHQDDPDQWGEAYIMLDQQP